MIAHAPTLRITHVYNDPTAPTGEGTCWVTEDGRVWREVTFTTETLTGQTCATIEGEFVIERPCETTRVEAPPPEEPEKEEDDDGRRIPWPSPRPRTRPAPVPRGGRGRYDWWQTGKRRF